MADSHDATVEQLLIEIHERLDGVESRVRRLAAGGRMTDLIDLILQLRYAIDQAAKNRGASAPDATGS